MAGKSHLHSPAAIASSEKLRAGLRTREERIALLSGRLPMPEHSGCFDLTFTYRCGGSDGIALLAYRLPV